MEKPDLQISSQKGNLNEFLPNYIDEETRDRFCNGELTFDDIRQYPELSEILLSDDIDVKLISIDSEINNKERKQEILDFASRYGNYLRDVNTEIFQSKQNKEELETEIQKNIEENILNRYKKGRFIRGVYRDKISYENSPYNEDVPDFFKKKHENMFLDEDAPEDLKRVFYDRPKGGKKIICDQPKDFISMLDKRAKENLTFQQIKENEEWERFLKGKDLRRAFSTQYKELFERIDSDTLLKIGTKNPTSVERMVSAGKEDILEIWCKSTGGRFVPHYTVMLNFPTDEIDNFLLNSKKWQKLSSIERYNSDDDGKLALLKSAYTMGVFHGNDEGFRKIMEIFTGIPKEITQEEYCKVIEEIDFNNPNKGEQDLFGETYKWGNHGTFELTFNQTLKKEKKHKKEVRDILEHSDISRLLSPERAKRIFEDFSMEYNPEFANFFCNNIEEIITNPEYMKNISQIQKKFPEILKMNAGRKITLGVANDYIKSMPYTGIEVGNENLAEKVKVVGYSQEDFNALQELYNEGEKRNFSSIPRIQGENKGYSYEILRCDDPLTLTIGRLTDCCQEIHQLGETSMKHSMLSPDGRVFCVKDDEGKIVAQSWVWRNQDVICFDNIEVPNRVFEMYEKKHPEVGRKGLTDSILNVYKQASQDLMRIDEETYGELLQAGDITQEQYDALVLGKVTVGLGFNDIRRAILEDEEINKDEYIKRVKKTDRISNLYTDASVQYILAEKEISDGVARRNLYVYQDDIPIYDNKNMPETVLATMKRMEQVMGKDKISHIYLKSRRGKECSQEYISEIAERYGFKDDDTKIMATARMALIYDQEEDKITIGDLLLSKNFEELDSIDEQEEEHIRDQVKRALKQLQKGTQNIDYSSLKDEEKQMIQSVLTEIEQENKDRDER